MYRCCDVLFLVSFHLESQSHERRGVVILEQSAPYFLEHGRCEGAPFLAELYSIIDAIAISDVAWVGEDGAISEGSWPELLPALVPANQSTLGQQISGRFSGILHCLVTE